MRLWFSRRVLKILVYAAHTALLKSRYRDDNAHSFACVRLFPASTQYPAGSPLTDFRVLQKRRKGANYRRFTQGLRAARTSSGLDIGVETGLAFTLSAFSFASSKISRIISAAASKVSRLSVSVGSNISAS